MPVPESESSPVTVRKASDLYSCHNGPRNARGYYAPQRVYHADGTFHMDLVFIWHTMSRECRYDMSLSDSRCEDCTWRGTGEAYARKNEDASATTPRTRAGGPT